jgi:hypothetical protein
VEAKIVCGPFIYQPFPGFRSNSIAAIEKNGSVRPIINMSRPEGFSFNDNLLENRLEKVHMGTSCDFGYALKEAGKGSLMSKYDLRDAYKLIPAKPGDWRLQGFSWGGRFFFESNMIFGASTSVANFDRLGSMLVESAVAKSGIQRKYVSRTLDDIPVIAPAGSANTLRFGMALRGICQASNILLAENCPEKVKAFEHSRQGVVLGIAFDSEKMQRALPSRKADKFLRQIIDTIHIDYISLNELQKVMGILNDLILMCPFVKPWRGNGNQLIGDFHQNEEIVLQVPEQLKKDLCIFARVIGTARGGIPISSRPAGPPLFSKHFYSYAAGCRFAWVNGNRVDLNAKEDAGVACIMVQEDTVQWWGDLSWPKKFIEQEVDEKGARFGSKTATLEAIGVLLPFLTIPEELIGQHVIFEVDNIAVVYGWEKRGIKFDTSATTILTAIHLISGYLGATVHICHVPRRSNRWAELADNLSRKSSTTYQDKRMLTRARRSMVKGELLRWLETPREYTELPRKLLKELKSTR